ncbi:glycosyl hydrolase [Mucilaginibacter sp. HMF5004]|uniref:glycoside hydrolase family 30 protein n=1 Tax=Mucilaginibacter rivuli TaxID=2857527 RepID=UPI001C5E1D9D|nr:glycoside hydrolase family 30 protein [Mucilaginibacter rivuli]MBW4888571.1 glycosyl hydrolase [Mucilaginibacter rivuli]
MKTKYIPITVCLATLLAGSARAQHVVPSKPFSVGNKYVEVYTTAKGTGYKLSKTATLKFEDKVQPTEREVCIFVDADKKFQSLLGIGSALTDASAETFYKLPKAKQQEFLTAFYDQQKGIGYSLARTNIQSCDFSSDIYSYVQDNDKSLKTFDIAHDMKYRVPFIKQAIAAAGGKLTLFASPWSPPAWMKDNNDVLHGGKLKKEFDQSWANFYVKFINAYQKQGIPVWGLTVQNEPMAIQKWESCVFTAAEERDFVKNYLGPTLHKNGMANKKLIVWDHNRDQVYQRASTILEDKEAAKYVWGVGYHWYETWTGSPMLFGNVKNVAEAFPGKNLLFTEGCIEKFDMARVNDWALGEKYGQSIIRDFNNGTVGWTDWNILLDEKGGPNHVGNYCFSPVIADTRSGELIYTNIYWYMGHFSKFVRPGDKRVISSSNRESLLTTAFINPAGQLAIIVMNQSDTDIPYNLCIKGKAATVNSLAHSISTLVVQ